LEIVKLAPSLQDLPAVSMTASKARVVDYLRISVTDRCNERCLYCLPETFQQWTPREEILSFDEILSVVEVAIERGFKHFRVTGGEPLIRKDIVPFMRALIETRGVQSVQVTTNGTQLPRLAEPLRKAGLSRLNISLDALDPARYAAITRGSVGPVLEGIHKAKSIGFESIKLNTVLIRHKNEDQLWPLVQFAASLQIPVRFIELMPVSLTEMLNEENFLPVGEVMRMLAEKDTLEPIEPKLGHGPAKYYRLRKAGAVVGFIGALTNLHFCDSCNKVRLTADGKLRPCLGNHGEYDLKPALRPFVNRDALHASLAQSLVEKPPEHIFRNNWQPNRIMTAIGG
jgi:cyclic pyranopterin phosphate synthase